MKSLEKAITKKINTIFNDLIIVLSSEIASYYPLNTEANFLLRKRLEQIRKELTSSLYLLTKEYMESSQDLAYLKNKKFVEDYIKNYKVPEVLITKWLKKESVSVGLQQLSGRIWKLSGNYFNMIELTLNAGLYDGLSAVNIAKDLRKLLNNPEALNINELRRLGIERVGGLKKYREIEKKILNYKPGRGVYKSAKKNAIRLVRSEINRAYGLQDHQQRNNLDFVIGQEVHLSASHPRPDMCDDLQGKYPKQFVFSSWHPQCLCYSTSITLSKEEFAEYLATGEVLQEQTKGIPESAENWINKNSQYLQKPKTYYWINDNFKKSDLTLLKKSDGI